MADSAIDERMMRHALRLAEGAAGNGDVPIGAVVARGDEVLGEAGNERELRGDSTAHAEVLALRQGGGGAGRAGGGFWARPATSASCEGIRRPTRRCWRCGRPPSGSAAGGCSRRRS